MSLVITRDEIAAELGLSRASAPAKLRRLMTQHGFPPPLPGETTRYSRHLVSTWFATNGGQSLSAAADDAPAPVDPVAAQRQWLEAKYLGGTR